MKTTIGRRKAAAHISVCYCFHRAKRGNVRQSRQAVGFFNHSAEHRKKRFSWYERMPISIVGDYFGLLYPLEGQFTSLKRGFKGMYVYGDFKGNLIHFVISIISLYSIHRN